MFTNQELKSKLRVLNDNIERIVIEKKLPYELESTLKFKDPPQTGRRFMNTSRSLAHLELGVLLGPDGKPLDEDDVRDRIPYKEI